MLQVNTLREHKNTVIEGLTKKNFKDLGLVDTIIATDDARKKAQSILDDTKASINAKSKEVGALMAQKKATEAEAIKAEVLALKTYEKEQETTLKTAEDTLYGHLVQLPNIPHTSVPNGKTPEENENILSWGQPPVLMAGAQPHWELTTKYDIIDFELGVKITGAGFPVYKGKGAKLQRALINFFLDEAEKAGYREMQPPILVNEASGFGTGQLPDKEGQMYHVGIDGLYLVPTAEVPITNLYRDVMVKEEDLPIKNTAYTPCFRREAGSYGAHVRGLNRLHQFDKVEIVQITTPESSYTVLEEMSLHVQGLLQKLELPYRVLRLCGGDMSFGSALTYDMEVYCAAQAKWLEVSSTSNFETFQTNRLKLRYKNKDGKTQLAHSLNGSALALPRIVASLLENNQTEKGIKIPAVLVPYTGFEYID